MKNKSQHTKQGAKDLSNWLSIYFKVKELGDLMHVETGAMLLYATALADQFSDQAPPVFERKEQQAAAIIEMVLQLAAEWSVPLAVAQQIAVGEAYRYTKANFMGLLLLAPAQMADTRSISS